MEQNLVLRVNTKSWLSFWLVNISRYEHVAFRFKPQFVGFSCKKKNNLLYVWMPDDGWLNCNTRRVRVNHVKFFVLMENRKFLLLCATAIA